jgi:alpha-1,3-mannosyltransferase
MVLRVLALTPAFFPEVGGIQKVIVDLAHSLKEHGVSVEVGHASPCFKNVGKSMHEGIVVHQMPVIGSKLIGYVAGLRTLAKAFDLIHVHDPQLLMLSLNVILQIPALPRVLSTHGGFFHTKRFIRLKRFHDTWLTPMILKRYDTVLASGPTDYDRIRTRVSNVLECFNGIDVAKYEQAKSSDQRRLTWIYWGRLSVNKNIAALINLVARCNEMGFPVELGVFTNDEEKWRTQIQPLVDALGVGERISAQFYLCDTDMLRNARKFSVFVTATEYEGFGLAVLEALAAGKPVICRDIAPINSFVSSDNGLFIDFMAGEDQDAAIRAFLESTDEAFTAKCLAAETTASGYDWPIAATRFLVGVKLALSNGR